MDHHSSHHRSSQRLALQRRTFLAGTAAAAAAALATPGVARAATTLRFVPYVDLAILDPTINTAAQTRTHGYMVFDTLYGTGTDFRPQPEMVEGHITDPDFRLWTLTLRQGLRFHDGMPVLARDVVASIRRWAVRDHFGASLLKSCDEMSAPSDRVIQFRMKVPFPLLPDALGKVSPTMAAIMPERLAVLDPDKAVPEIVGSGPFRYVADERVPGSLNVYERFSGYVPRSSGTPGLTSGPKIAQVDRVEWMTMPDGVTAAAALRAGEVDWVEAPHADLLSLLRRDPLLVIAVKDKTGTMPVIRFNCLNPPFDNPAIRRVVLNAVDQREFMSAFSGDDGMWYVKAGAFTPGTPMANDAGLKDLFGPSDHDRAKAALAEAGYSGERVVIMGPADHPVNSVMAEVATDLMAKIGFNCDLQTMDSGTMFQRRNNHGPVDQGGWSVFPSMVGGLDVLNPAVSFLARGNGEDAWYGWPTSQRMEDIRASWLNAGDEAAQQSICRTLQMQVWQDAPYVPLGQVFQPAAWRRNVTGILDGIPKFWNVRKA